jgi:DNA replication and repair protein RecF
LNIRNIHLKNFRNYKILDLKFERDFNIIYGKNAQGKTNILEAIFLCSAGRSHRTSKDHELIKFGEDNYSVKIDLNKDAIEKSIEVVYDKVEKKKIKINEIPLKKIGNLMGQLNAIMFSPEDMMIIKEGPAERRRFIDIALSQLKPSYFYDLQQYIKILAQRNNLLKEIEYNKSLLDTIEVWNQSLAEKGSRIIKARKEYVDILARKAEEIHGRITNRNEKLKIRYMPSLEGIQDFSDLSYINKVFLNNLERVKKRELIKCTTMVGPHRDEYELLVNNESLKLYGSQGQQRTAILSIKLSEVEIVKDEIGEYPVLLLDDVMSELDKNRQDYLLKNLRGIQTFITCTEKDNIEKETGINMNYIAISGGQVVSEEQNRVM